MKLAGLGGLGGLGELRAMDDLIPLSSSREQTRATRRDGHGRPTLAASVPVAQRGRVALALRALPGRLQDCDLLRL
jgi:hypothetical protein